jgi:uracil-xanthine permease
MMEVEPGTPQSTTVLHPKDKGPGPNEGTDLHTIEMSAKLGNTDANATRFDDGTSTANQPTRSAFNGSDEPSQDLNQPQPQSVVEKGSHWRCEKGESQGEGEGEGGNCIGNPFRFWKETKSSIVMPDERLSWGRTIGIGLQHCVAMFGGTVLVPLLTHFSPSTSLFFSGIGTLIFIITCRNQLPSYLGSSFCFVAPTLASATKQDAQGGIFATGLLIAIIGTLVHFTGDRWLEKVFPPVVTGTVIVIIGLNLAPVAKDDFSVDPLSGAFTLFSIMLLTIKGPGIIGRLSIFLGVVMGTIFAALVGQGVDLAGVKEAPWFGLPPFRLPTFSVRSITMCLPTVIITVAENAGHVKAVAAMTERNLDPLMGRAFFADGIATMLAGFCGGMGTTTYAENIGVMASSRVYSTLVYVIAAFAAIFFALCPVVGALIEAIPRGVLGGASTVLYGMIAVLGVRLWIDAQVDFRKTSYLVVGGTCLIIGAADFTVKAGPVEVGGIGLGCILSVVLFPLAEWLENVGRGRQQEAPNGNGAETTESGQPMPLSDSSRKVHVH